MIEKKEIKTNSKLQWLVAFAAIVIVILVVFANPMPGVADQGDFQRVMGVTGLEEIKENINSYQKIWYKYVTTEYEMVALDFLRVAGIKPTTSIIYPVLLARVICKIFRLRYFSTNILAAIYSLMYIYSLNLCLKWCKVENRITRVFLILCSLIILMDGNYLIWFNSLYGEPMMMVGLLTFIASTIYVFENIEQVSNKHIILLFASSLLFLGSKTQCFSAFPLVIFIFIRIYKLRKISPSTANLTFSITLAVLMLSFYVGGIYFQGNSNCGIDTEYNSVFYGILKNSQEPKKDLERLGLSQDMVVDAGKHAYLPKEQYIKYVPWSETTKKEFNEKVSNIKLLKFYLFQPKSLIKGMEYTATKTFDTRGFLGKYEKRDVEEYTYTFQRFTLWSDFRSESLPKKLSFIIIFYFFIVLFTIVEYRKARENLRLKLRIELIWVIMLIGLLQFPMPYIGNGEADTSKQLFLFNYSFDIMVIIICTWVFNEMISIYKKLSWSFFK
jgi:hypothetical protein